MISLLLVRHGESRFNTAGRVPGQAPGNPLTPRGREQARAAATRLLGREASWMLSSDLTRAAQTATLIGEALSLPVVLEPALREQALGDLEGRLAAELTALPTPEGVEVTSVRWGGGESIEDVYARLHTFLDRLLTERDGSTGILISHETALQVLLAILDGRGHAQVEWTPIGHGDIVHATLG